MSYINVGKDFKMGVRLYASGWGKLIIVLGAVLQYFVRITAGATFDYNLAASQVSSALQASGYATLAGEYQFFFLEDCDEKKLPSCFALNADSPYGMTLLPPASQQNAFTDCVDKTGRCGLGCNPDRDPNLIVSVCENDNMSMQWLLGSDEAVVIIGLSPPEAVYWSITSYVMSQRYADSPRIKQAQFSSMIQGLAVSCRAGPARCQKFASLGNPFNFHTLADAANGNTGFGEPFALVMTGSKATFESVDSAIKAATGAVGAQVFLVPVPTDLLNLDSSNVNDRDTLSQLMRIAYAANSTQMNEYYKSTPLAVLRVTPTTDGISGTNSHYTRSDVKFTSRKHTPLERGGQDLSHGQLVNDLHELRDAIRAKHSPLGGGADTPFTKPFFVTGLDCIDEGTECNADCPDTLYPISSNVYDAVGCELIPVLGIGTVIAVVAALVAFLVYFAPSCQRGCMPPGNALCCGCKPPRDNAACCNKKGKVHVGLDKEKKLHWCWGDCCPNTCGRLAASAALWWGVSVLVALVAFFAVMIPVLSVYGSWCKWGHAATIDSGDRDFFVVYGINHKATEHASYSSITAYHYEKLSGIVAKSSESGFRDSAALYLDQGTAHRANDYLFAYRFARDCVKAGLTAGTTNQPSDYCFDVPKDGPSSLPLNAKIFWIARMYINPKTGTGPSAEKTILGSVLHFW